MYHPPTESASGLSHKKVVLDLGHPCNALCLNKESTLLVAAGRKGIPITSSMS